MAFGGPEGAFPWLHPLARPNKTQKNPEQNPIKQPENTSYFTHYPTLQFLRVGRESVLRGGRCVPYTGERVPFPGVGLSVSYFVLFQQQPRAAIARKIHERALEIADDGG